MADKKNTHDDLSIEEILGSIRRIIAEDEDDVPKTKTNAAFDSDLEDEEPLELTQKIDDNGVVAHTAIDELDMDDVSDDIIDIGLDDDIAVEEETPVAEDMIEEEIPAPFPAPRAEEPKPMSTENAVQDNLLSPSASIATAAVMAKLARQAAVNEDGNGALTIEAMVREMLRPILKEWLDANLPDLVQKMVERELDRLTKRL